MTLRSQIVGCGGYLPERIVTNDELARVESGLKAGESVVLKPSKALREGSVVKVAE